MIQIYDGDDLLTFAFADVERYHGQGSIGGAALGFKVLEAGLAALCDGRPPRRDELTIVSGHPGPGFRDAFELVTRAVTRGALRVDTTLPDGRHNPFHEHAYSFAIGAERGSVEIVLRAGLIPHRFFELWHLVGNGTATADERRELIYVKRAVADDALARSAEELFAIEVKQRDAAPEVGPL